MNKKDVQYWGSLDVSIEDTLEEVENIKEQIVTKVANKLGQNDDWLKVIRIVTGKSTVLNQILADLYAHDKDLFYSIYASAKFSERIIDQSIIRNKAKRVLTERYSEALSLQLDEPKALVLLVFLVNRDAIIDIYYDDLLGKSSMRTYYCNTTNLTEYPHNLDKLKAQKLLRDYEQTRKKNQRRRSKTWWLINEDSKIKLFFRREKKGRTAVRKVDHNEFIKTADWKIFVFSENGKKLDMFSSREPKRTVRIADFIASRVFGHEISYEEKHIDIQRTKVDGFITAIKKSSVDLLELRVKNTPLPGSPFMDLRTNSSDPLNKAVTDLVEIHTLNVVSHLTKLQSAKIRIKGKIFNIRFEPLGSGIRIICRNKGYGEKEREMIETFFSSFES